MSTLHMEVQTVLAAQSKIEAEKEAILSELNTLTNQVNQMIGSDWIGNSALEFKQAFQLLRSQFLVQLDYMESMAKTLQVEITQWQDMAAKFG